MLVAFCLREGLSALDPPALDVSPFLILSRLLRWRRVFLRSGVAFKWTWTPSSPTSRSGDFAAEFWAEGVFERKDGCFCCLSNQSPSKSQPTQASSLTFSKLGGCRSTFPTARATRSAWRSFAPQTKRRRRLLGWILEGWFNSSF